MNDRDPEFVEKAVAIIELILGPPPDGPLYCVDEKPGIGVREPTAPDHPPQPARPPRRGRPAQREFEYKRHGTVSLLAAFRVNDGQVRGVVRPRHRSQEFCELLTILDQETPLDQVIHVILDNLSMHRSAHVAAWLAEHPSGRFVFYWLPVHSSWLSYIEVWFSILARKCLKRARFAAPAQAVTHINSFIAMYNQRMAHPFTWKKGLKFYRRLKDKLATPTALAPAA